jgi:hypothetical protein
MTAARLPVVIVGGMLTLALPFTVTAMTSSPVLGGPGGALLIGTAAGNRGGQLTNFY